jgi:hypothetical protein
MAGSSGPDLVQNGLVLAYDAADKNSCGGQPTTNLLTYSNALNNAIWVGYCGSTSNITYNTTDITDPIGTNTAAKIARNNVAVCGDVGAVAWGLLYAPASNILTAGKTYTVSIYARGAVGGESFAFGLNDSHTTFITLSTTWTRYSYTFTNISGVDRGFQFLNNTATSQVYYVWGVQTQEGSVAGPYAASGASNGTANLNWFDLSGNANNGVFTNSPSFNNSNGGAISFDGTDDYVSITNNSTLRPTTELTIEYIIKGTTPSGWCPIIGYGNGDYANGNYLCWVETGGALNSLCRINNGGVIEYRQYSGIGISSTTLKYMSFTMKIGDSIKSYYNGINTNTPTSLPAGGTFYYGGTTSPYQIVGLGGAWLNGSISFIRLYNRALTASEILQNYNVTKTRFGL